MIPCAASCSFDSGWWWLHKSSFETLAVKVPASVSRQDTTSSCFWGKGYSDVACVCGWHSTATATIFLAALHTDSWDSPPPINPPPVLKYMLACPLENATTVAVAFETTQSIMTPHGSVGAYVAASPAFSRVIPKAMLRRPRYTSLGAGFCNLHSVIREPESRI
jgi:hypothetical protein